MNPQSTVRAFFRAIKVENTSSPYDTLHLKIYYPGQLSGDNQEQNLGVIPPKSEQAPFPIVIFFNGINCPPDVYQWLAVDLATQGLVVITFAWVAENLPGMVSLTPGVDIEAWSPDNYGKKATASALPVLMQALENLQAEGLLAGLLDLDQVILGGHSAGGRVAIESASQTFFPQLAGAFAYAAHTVGGVNLGYKPGTILPLPDSLPLLLLGGTEDGVIANNSHQYGLDWETATTPILRTFQESISGGRGDSYLVLFEGANHFSIAHPHDSTTGTSFLDFPATQPETEIRSLMARIISLFIQSHIMKGATNLEKREELQNLLRSNQPLLKTGQWK
ncbi:MAG: dienelactone hydrolase [Halothece sp. Uz-M2-17]|nr:dienelactone hydrolase [Halothece sp. Uz-M2-17]